MSRFAADYRIDKPDDFIKFVSEDFFAKEGFRPAVYKGESVWKKGTGFVTAPQYIKLQYGQGNIHIEAWIKSFGEHGLDGFYGAIPKSELNSRVHTLINLLTQNVAIPQANTAPGEAQPTDDAKLPVQTPVKPVTVPVAVHNPTSKATTSLVLSIISIITGLFIPIVGLITGIIGITTGNVGRKSTAKSLATAGFVLGIIGTVISAANWLLAIIASVMYLY